MVFINKKLIKVYLNNKKKYIITKSKSSTIIKEMLGRTVLIYNGNKWLEKKINNQYLIGKKIGMLKNLESKLTSVYKSKKQSKKKQDAKKKNKKK